MTKPSVFISSMQRDAGLAQRFEDALEHLGVEAFNAARELQPGADWRKAIRDAIKRSDALVMVVSAPQLAGSSWIGYEAGMADALGKRVMVLVPHQYPLAELPADVASAQIVDFDPQAPERAARDVAARLAAA
jgi:hypothetical protein